MFRHPFVAPANKCANRRRGSIKNVDPIFFDDFPKPIGLRPVRCALVHDDRGAIGKRSIDNITVTGDPPHISRAPKDIFIANVEDVSGGRINMYEITAGGVQNSLWLSSGPAGVEKVKRMLAVERCRWAVCIDILQFPVPPNIAAFLHVDVVSGPAKNDYAPDRCAITKCVIDILLQRHNPAAAIGTVGGDERDGAAVDNPISNAVGAKSTENDRVHGANPRAGQHGNCGLGNVREINDHPISLFYVVPLQYIREAANFAMQLLVGEGALVAGFSLPDNCRLVSARPTQMPIETIF